VHMGGWIWIVGLMQRGWNTLDAHFA